MNERQNGHVSVNHVHADDPIRDRHQKLWTAFRELEQKIQERDEKSSDHQESAEYIPRFDVPPQKPLRFFGDVRVPYQHVLGKADISPENRESEKQLPHDVIVLFVHEL